MGVWRKIKVFMTSELYGDERSASRSSCFVSEHTITEEGFDRTQEREILIFAENLNTVFQPEASPSIYPSPHMIAIAVRIFMSRKLRWADHTAWNGAQQFITW